MLHVYNASHKRTATIAENFRFPSPYPVDEKNKGY